MTGARYSPINSKYGCLFHRFIILSATNKFVYALHHQYDFALVGSNMPHRPLRNFSWQKVLHLRDIISAGLTYGHDTVVDNWILMVDLDAFVMNMNVTLASLVDTARAKHGTKPLDIIIAEDCNGINAGVFMIRVSEWSLQFLNQVWESDRDAQIPHLQVFWEQAVMADLFRRSEEHSSHVCKLPQRAINAYPHPIESRSCFQVWEQGDFILHFPGPFKTSALATWLPRIHNITRITVAGQM